MEHNRCFSHIYRFRRVISICIGVLSAIPWMFLTFSEGMAIYSMSVHYGGRAIFFTHSIVHLICFAACIIISVVMVFGAIKRIANFILPWLAIHFVTIMYATSMTAFHVVLCIFSEDRKYIGISMVLELLFTVVLIFSFGLVYIYWKSLNTPTYVQPSCSVADQTFKTLNETRDEIV